jgi:uncharacterized membrane protein YhaH (DUF805 family)
MDNSQFAQLVEFIKQSMNQKLDEQTIRNSLLQRGWSPEAISQGFQAANSNAQGTTTVLSKKSGLNVFNGPLNRVGFLIWTVFLAIIVVVIFDLIISTGKSTHKGNYWEPFRYAYDIVFLIFLLIAYIQRIRSTKVNMWTILLFFLPGINAIFGLVLLVLPTKV